MTRNLILPNPPAPIAAGSANVAAHFASVRAETERLASPLSPEDAAVASTEETSPAKWHLAHTTWFFEKFLLREAGHPAFSPDFDFLFNSYYQSLGGFIPKAARGQISRPGLDEVLEYRRAVTKAVSELSFGPEQIMRLELGIHHEQQHQELLLMDTLQNFYLNPLNPAYRAGPAPQRGEQRLAFLPLEGGLVKQGASEIDFSYDNEKPRHNVWLDSFALANRPVTNGEYMEFIEAGGYRDPRWWLSDGWDFSQKNSWSAPLYWREGKVFSLEGWQPLDPHAYVCHVSYYEADAYARFRGARLPTETELELAAFPKGEVWEWAASAYLPYPGYVAPPGPLAEYNGKFFCNQMVLRGGSFATPDSHYRTTYRNFYYPHHRWQFAGIRLAQNGRKK